MFGRLAGAPLEAVSHDVELVPAFSRVHAPALAVELAFVEHRPLSISPDAIWITLSQGFARHANQNAEALRKRLVRHEGKKKIEIGVSSLPSSRDQWSDIIGRLGQGVAEHVGPGIACCAATFRRRHRLLELRVRS